MNYIKPEDIKAYVEQNPEGIAGMSEELATMANHFAELIVRECICQCDDENSQKYIMSHFRSLLPIGFTEKDWS